MSACLLVLAARPAAAQTQTPDLVLVQTFDVGASVQLMIIRGEDKSEKVEFRSGGSDKGLTASGEGYYKVFSKLYQEGYALQSTFTTHKTCS